MYAIPSHFVIEVEIEYLTARVSFYLERDEMRYHEKSEKYNILTLLTGGNLLIN